MKNAKKLGVSRVQGFGIELRLLKEADLPLVCQWRNEPDIRSFMDDSRTVTIPVMTAWYRKILQQDTIYAYIASVQGMDFGYLEFKNINPATQSCELGIFLENCRTGSGMGLYPVLCGERILEALKLSDFFVRIRRSNKNSLKFFKKLGAEFSHQEGDFLVYIAEYNRRREQLRKLAHKFHVGEEFDTLFPNCTLNTKLSFQQGIIPDF